MRRLVHAVALVSACAYVAGCAAPTADDRPVVHIAPAAQPSPTKPVEQALPTNDELTVAFGGPGFTGQVVKGGPDMLLQSVGEGDATPADCVSAAYRLEKVAYGGNPVQSVASQTWTGGSFDTPPKSGFFGVVKFASADDAHAFFAATATKWNKCNGQTLVLRQPEHGAQGSSKVTDVTVDDAMLSAIVMRDDGSAIQRALGVSADCVVDVEISDVNHASDPQAAVGLANTMLRKAGAP